jgi:hypothetical protein
MEPDALDFDSFVQEMKEVERQFRTDEMNRQFFLKTPTGFEYGIDFEGCDTNAKLLARIVHIAPKNWVTKEQIVHLIHAACAHSEEINIDYDA